VGVRRLDIRVCRRSAFLICDPGAIEMDAGPTAGAIRRDRGRSFSFFVEQNSGANAPRERSVIASASEACHRAGHFGPDPLAPALLKRQPALVGCWNPANRT